MSSNTVVASPRVLNFLQKLHAASLAQESSFSLSLFWVFKLFRDRFFKESWNTRDDDFMRDKFIALEPDKCEFLYLLARTTGALNIVEAGTSFGVSTIYLALAAGQNAAAKATSGPIIPGQGARVIATEKEPEKAKRARQHWKETGEEVEPWITLLEGDLRELLPVEVNKTDQIDLLLLDIWTPMVLPALQAVQPKLRHGALIVADNTKMARSGYKDFFDYVNNPANGFKTMTTPFKGGLEVAVYLPSNTV
ncbi:O-methyltransferase [Coccidioides immitis RS]|uniref:O-methyltransferase n=2 Tax=Coccidioides immitis TaxID=5501 RepID=J3K8H6_COCIM|nr:O-methyltransferase [Coccidioides immitis RS]EAS31123.3 O-methyltransferase [Coccidioides immitis RS]KMU74703.1 O-methyltransferase [Coccidioides immitis RMSCC 3703]